MPSATEQEFDDVQELKRKVEAEKVSCFNLMFEYMRYDPKHLQACGHKSVESALVSSMNYAIKAINKLNAEFLKKWPDE